MGDKKIIIDNKRPFFNPYNFVEIDFSKNSNNKKPFENNKENKLRTGVINCRIKTKTKLFVPESNAASEDNKHKTYTFMKNPDGDYIIPGSSLRGTIRSVYEAATDSCFSVLSNSKYLSSRYNGKKVKPGLLIKSESGWKLFSAEQYYFLVENLDDPNHPRKRQGDSEQGYDADYQVDTVEYITTIKKNGNAKYNEIRALQEKEDKVFIRVNKREMFSGERITIDEQRIEKRKSKREGIPAKKIIKSFCSYKNGDKSETYLFLGEDCQNRHYSRVFRKKDSIKEFEENAWEIKALVNTIKEYRDTKSNKNYYELGANNHRGYGYIKLDRNGEKIENTEIIPLWYEEINDKYYLQLAAMGRRTYKKTLEDFIVHNKGGSIEVDEVHKPCTSRTKLCEACSLFGMIKGEGDKEAKSLGSRVRFTDAVTKTPQNFCDPNDEEKYYILEILSTPHIYLPFFAKNNENKEAMFDGDYNKIVNLRGRKFYLHAPKEEFEKLNSQNKSNNNFKKGEQNITAQVADEGAEFTFSIYFENVTDDELNKLIWSLNFGENDKDGTYCHKIGHGKPIGLGSAKIIVESITERSFANGEYQEREKRSVDDIYKAPFSSENKRTESIKKICDYDGICKKKIPVHYPGWRKSKNEGDEVKSFEWFENNKSLQSKNNSWKGLLLQKLYEPLHELEKDNKWK